MCSHALKCGTVTIDAGQLMGIIPERFLLCRSETAMVCEWVKRVPSLCARRVIGIDRAGPDCGGATPNDPVYREGISGLASSFRILNAIWYEVVERGADKNP